MTEESEYPSLIESYKTIVTYKSNLFKLQALIQLEKDDATREEFLQMKNDLTQAIQYQDDQIKKLQGTDTYLFSVERLVKTDKDRLCKVHTDSWALGYVVEVDLEQQQAKVVQLASGRVASFDSVLVMIQP